MEIRECEAAWTLGTRRTDSMQRRSGGGDVMKERDGSSDVGRSAKGVDG
jgi:hypothetical protein